MAPKAIAATLFVVIFAFVLAQPVLRSGDAPDQNPAAPARSTPTQPPKSEPPGSRRANIPFDCTGRKHSGVAPDRDLVAAVTRTGIALARPDGSEIATVDGSAPLGFSPSGILATGENGLLWFSDGSPWERGEQQISLGEDLVTWGWSSVSDCAATINKSGALALLGYLGIPPGAEVTLFERNVESFAFSPDGRWLAVSVRDQRAAQIWLVNLREDKLRLLKQFRSGTCCVILGGWTYNQSVLYWAGPGVSVMADGWPLRSFFVAPSNWGSTLPTPDVLSLCSRRILKIDLQDRSDEHGDLVQIYPRHRIIARGAFSQTTCSESGAATVVVEKSGARSRLVLIDDNGRSVLVDDSEYSDFYPEWGPGGTGVLFLRARTTGSDDPELWFIHEGVGPRPVGLTLQSPSSNYRAIPWNRVLDWSATPPSGLPEG